MPRFSDDVSTSGALRGNDLVATNGVHGEANFDKSTGLRKAQSAYHEIHLTYRVASGVSVADIGLPMWTANEVTEVVAGIVVPEAKPSGDYDYDIDLQKGDAGTAFATILSAPLTINSSSGNLTPQSLTIDSTKKTATSGQTLKLTVDAEGTTGAQGTGLVITIIIRVRPQS